MSLPRIAGKRCFSIELKTGETIHWCSCGLSENQPFCDGSHAGTGFEPMAFTPEADDKYYFCTCKRTAKPPFCDGAHKRLAFPEDEA